MPAPATCGRDMRETEPGRELAGGSVPGSSGSDVLASELGLVLDSRDNAGAPRTGTYARFMPSIAAKAIGSDFAFRRLTIDARRYDTFGANHVVAAQLQYDGVSGTTPFDQMPMIGADTAMRGYARGRFRDRHAVTAQAEARSAFWRRVGGVAFAGAGTVAPSLSTAHVRQLVSDHGRWIALPAFSPGPHRCASGFRHRARFVRDYGGDRRGFLG